MRRICTILVFLLAWFPAAVLSAQEKAGEKSAIDIDLSEFQKEVDQAATKPYSLVGFFEFQPTLFGIDRDSAVSRALL